MKILSLIPSATEMVCALGFAENLVGRSHECDFPEGLSHLPVCTEPKFNPDGSSEEIDQSVKDILKQALSVYNVHEDKLAKLAPDIILTQAKCEVCAVSLKDVEAAVASCTTAGAKVVSLQPNVLADLWCDMQAVADALGVTQKGHALIADCKRRMADIADKASGARVKPTVATIEWIAPLMAGGNWIPELITMAGGKDLFGKTGHNAPWLDWEGLIQKDPDCIIVMPCGFGIAKSIAEMDALTTHEKWPALRAVKNDQVYVADGNHYFNRSGPRLVESLEILAEILHPNLFDFGHKDQAWVKFS